MGELFFDRQGVCDAFPERSWQYIMFQEFEAGLSSKTRLFPCIYGVAGYQSDQLRYCFSEDLAAEDIAPALTRFVENSRSFGSNTSLVVFSRPRPTHSLAHYQARFWDLLNELHEEDEQEWPNEIPKQVNDPKWEFSFAGEPIFVVCNTPAHVIRQSRRSSSFMVTFQPRWVFDGILSDPETAIKATRKVRERLENYDLVPPSPDLGFYGETDNRESAQYFLEDSNTTAGCPFHQLSKSTDNKEKIA